MGSFLEGLFSKQPSSASKAKERLQLVLINDRTDLTPGAIELLKDDLLKVLSKYIEIDTSSVTIDLTQEGRQQRLIADIPIVGPPKRKR
jgi:cell division topological specificity factor